MRWALLAVLGIVLAAGASFGANELASQPIGLESEPITAGDQLAPKLRTTPTPTPRPKPSRTPVSTPTPVPTVDDDSGSDDHGGDDSSGRGRGRGRGGDDD